MHKKRVKNKFYYYYTTVREGSRTKSVYLGKNFFEAKRRKQQLNCEHKSFKFNLSVLAVIILLVNSLSLLIGLYFFKPNITGLATFATTEDNTLLAYDILLEENITLPEESIIIPEENITLPEENITNIAFIPSKEVYKIFNCPGCPTLKNSEEQLCLQMNAPESDYGAEIVFETLDHTSASYAEVCMYKFLISRVEEIYDNKMRTKAAPRDIILTNYISPVRQVLSESTSVKSLSAEWSSVGISQKNGWVCADITNTVNQALLEGKKQFSIRWWGPDLKNKASLPYICFRGPKTTLDQCDNDNPSGANDCRPYMRVIEK